MTVAYEAIADGRAHAEERKEGRIILELSGLVMTGSL